jgi:PTS system mannose-specific IIA component
MIGGVIVSHGQLATELLAAAGMIVGEIKHITAASIGWNDEVDSAREQVARAIESVNSGDGVIVLTDMFGGTPTNIAATFLGEKPVEVVTGVNLPMVIKVASQEAGENLAELARRVRDQGKEQICLASEILAPRKR